MNSPEPFDVAFADSLRQLSPAVPQEIKSRLLYECGVSAAQTKIRKQQWRNRIGSSAALLVAVALGAVAGNQFSNSQQQEAVAELEGSEEHVQPKVPRPTFFLTANSSTLTAAMPASRVYELLERETDSEPVDTEKSNTLEEAPFGTFSYPRLLK